MELEIVNDVAASLPTFIEDVYNAERSHPALDQNSPIAIEAHNVWQTRS
jgi:hypothetical protein